MKMKKAASNIIDIRATKKQTTKSNVNIDDVTRMKFLEQSAQYLGVYIENRPAEWLDKHSVS